MKKRFFGKLFYELFVALLALILLLEVGVVFFSFGQGISDSKKATYDENMLIVDNVIAHVNDMLSDIAQIAENLKNKAWITKLSADSTIFDEEFSYNRRKEIVQDFMFYITAQSAVDGRFVYFANKNTIVASNNWSTASYYLTTLGIPSDKCAGLLEEITQQTALTPISCLDKNGKNLLNKREMIVVPLQNVEKPSVYLCTLVSAEDLKDDVSHMLSQSIKGLMLSTVEGYNIFTLGQVNGDEHVITSTVARTNWQIAFYIDNNVITVETGFLANFSIVPYILLFVTAALLALGLSMLICRPLEKIIRRTPGEKAKTGYRALTNSVEQMLLSYEENRRFSALHHLLTGFFDMDSEALEALPFTNDMWMRVFLCAPRIGEKSQKEMLERVNKVFLAEEGIRYAIIQAYNRNILVIAGFDDTRKIEILSAKMSLCLQESMGHVYVGSVSPGLIGASVSYQAAMQRQKLEANVMETGYYFPLEWESQFLTALRKGNSLVTKSILNKVFSENETRLQESEVDAADCMQLVSQLTADLTRSIREIGLEEEIIQPIKEMVSKNAWQTVFQAIILASVSICDAVQEKVKCNISTAQKIVDYVDSHFTDSSLYITTLCDALGVSASTANKCLKSLTSKTFLPYLTVKRMEEAKKYLLQGELKISTISQMVGYENEYSFRRAFLQYSGIRAQDYRTNHVELKDNMEEKP